MKTINRISIIMAVILLSFSINSCKEEPIPPTSNGVMLINNTITLYVDTGNISDKNLDATCNFGQENGESNENYTTLVKLEDEITWVGKSSTSEGDIVKIKLIKHINGKKILNRRRLPGDTKVVGKVKNGKKDDVEKYTIKFTVFNNGIKRNGNFTIDPKLQVIN